MRFDTTRCLECGGPTKRFTELEATHYDEFLQQDGTVPGTQYWFCSGSCFERAKTDFVEPHYRPNATNPENDPLTQGTLGTVQYDLSTGRIDQREASDRARQAGKNFIAFKGLAQWRAAKPLLERIRIEAERIEDEERAKLEDQEMKEAERKRERQEREEKQARERREREEQREQDRKQREIEREANRLRIKAEREEERQRALEEKEGAKRNEQEAEEAKWRPKPLDL